MPDPSASKFSVRNVQSKGKVKDWMVEGKKKVFISFHWLVCWIQHAEAIEDGRRWLQVIVFQYHLWWLHQHYKQYFGCWVVFSLLTSNRIIPMSVVEMFPSSAVWQDTLFGLLPCFCFAAYIHLLFNSNTLKYCRLAGTWLYAFSRNKN